MFGNPYFESDREWPVNKDTGKPLEFIFQIVNSEQTPLPLSFKVLQVFIDPENIPHSESDAGICIRTYKDYSTERLARITKPYREDKPMTVLMNSQKSSSLPDNEDRPGEIHEIGRQIQDIDPESDYFDIFDDIYGELGVDEFDISGIGGYPHWLQGAEMPVSSSGKKCDFLCEIHGGFKWNFMAALLFFVNPDDPMDIRFVHQYT
jgi:hypothetical protein